MTVALVLVSHSARLAEGVAEVVAQMTPEVLLVPAGGGPDGSVGTSFDRVAAALAAACGDGRSAIVLTDLGSARLTANAVLDHAAADVVARVRVADAPFVEGAMAGAVAAAAGRDLLGVLDAAQRAAAAFPAATPAGRPAAASAPPDASRTVTLRNPLGLHARPAALLSRMLAGYRATVRIDGADAASVLDVLKLGAVGGREVTVTGDGEQAAEAVDAVVTMIVDGFGET